MPFRHPFIIDIQAKDRQVSAQKEKGLTAYVIAGLSKHPDLTGEQYEKSERTENGQVTITDDSGSKGLVRIAREKR
ncbi:hypothetical protein JCM10550A_18090 [Methanogenium cariaci]|jgi:hypothetical protein